MYRVVLNKHNRSFEQNVSAASPDLRSLFISPRVIVLPYLMITFAYVFLAENPRCLGHTRLSCKVFGTKQAIAKAFELLCKKGGLWIK